MKKCKDCEFRPTQLEKLKNAVESAKIYAVIAMAVIIVVGILAIFICSICNKEIPGLSEMNLFVGIVLGVVATIVSIVSMLISFYGLEKTEESERRQHNILEEMIEIEKETRSNTQSIKTSLNNQVITNRDAKNAEENNPADDY